jgi:thiol:disulfide interchange protein
MGRAFEKDLAAQHESFLRVPIKERGFQMLHSAILALLLVLSGNGPSEVASSESSEPLNYEAAYRKAQEERKPLVVLVGADWCAACKTMKADTIVPMKRAGDLNEVVFTQLDKDAQPELANQVMQGKVLPQLVVFCESESGWKRFSLTGMQSERRVKELLRKASEVLPDRR